MKRAELGLLEVLGLLVECRGKVMSRLSPCFARELGILLCYLILRPFLSFFTTKYSLSAFEKSDFRKKFFPVRRI
jgi:hypothetical protein